MSRPRHHLKGYIIAIFLPCFLCPSPSEVRRRSGTKLNTVGYHNFGSILSHSLDLALCHWMSTESAPSTVRFIERLPSTTEEQYSRRRQDIDWHESSTIQSAKSLLWSPISRGSRQRTARGVLVVPAGSVQFRDSCLRDFCCKILIVENSLVHGNGDV